MLGPRNKGGTRDGITSQAGGRQALGKDGKWINKQGNAISRVRAGGQ